MKIKANGIVTLQKCGTVFTTAIKTKSLKHIGNIENIKKIQPK